MCAGVVSSQHGTFLPGMEVCKAASGKFLELSKLPFIQVNASNLSRNPELRHVDIFLPIPSFSITLLKFFFKHN